MRKGEKHAGGGGSKITQQVQQRIPSLPSCLQKITKHKSGKAILRVPAPAAAHVLSSVNRLERSRPTKTKYTHNAHTTLYK